MSNKSLRDDLIQEEAKNNLLELAEKLGRTPKRREFEEKYGRRNAITRIFGKWNNFVIAAGLETTKNVSNTISDEELANKIYEYKDKYTETPTLTEFIEFLGQRVDFQNRFGGYNKFLNSLNLSSKTSDEVIEITKNALVKNTKNSLGMSGIYMLENSKGVRFKATLNYEGKIKYLGTYDTLNEAKTARLKAEEKYWGKVYSEDTRKD